MTRRNDNSRTTLLSGEWLLYSETSSQLAAKGSSGSSHCHILRVSTLLDHPFKLAGNTPSSSISGKHLNAFCGQADFFDIRRRAYPLQHESSSALPMGDRFEMPLCSRYWDILLGFAHHETQSDGNIKRMPK